MAKIYIAGPMTGLPDFNYPAFHDAAQRWRDAGYAVENPAEHFEGDTTLDYQTYLTAAIQTLLHCSAVAVLPGWERSRGALAELHVACTLGLPIYDADVPLVPLTLTSGQIGYHLFRREHACLP